MLRLNDTGVAVTGGSVFKVLLLLSLKFFMTVLLKKKKHHDQSPHLPASCGYDEQLEKAMFQKRYDDQT